MKPFRIRIGAFARAFVEPPSNPLIALEMLMRGWRPCDFGWWSKGSPNQRRERP